MWPGGRRRIYRCGISYIGLYRKFHICCGDIWGIHGQHLTVPQPLQRLELTLVQYGTKMAQRL
jgi:hypothetical protein